MAVFRKKNVANASTRTALPAPLANLLRESWWLLLVAVVLYLVLALATYHPSDPGWSHSATQAEIRNRGGWLGARVADIFLSLFGLSAWWWVPFCLAAILWGYRRIDRVNTESSRPVIFFACTGFAFMLLASCSLETLRLHSLKIPLPDAPGGILGYALGGWLLHGMGFAGATLTLVAVFGIGFSLFTGVSWLDVMERTGSVLEWMYASVRDRWAAAQDRKIGRQAAEDRKIKVTEEKKRQEEHAPIKIEAAQLEVPVAPAAERKLEKEKKAQEKQQIEAERQAAQPSLFELDELPAARPAPKQGNDALPPLSLLAPAPVAQETISTETLEFTSNLIERKLADFNVQVKVIAAYPGPVITRYEIEPAVGVKGAQIVNLMKDLARALGLVSIRVVETIPGKTCMGLELPNPSRQTIRLSEIIASEPYHHMSSRLTMALGKDITGKPIVTDLGKAPHLLVAGTTGSGKSVGVNAMILSLLYKATPEEVRFIMVDPKMLELSVYDGIPHLLAPVVTDMKLAANALNWCVAEMEKRYRLMSSLGVRNLAGYNQKIKDAEKAGQRLTNPFTLTPDNPEPLEHLPFIVVVVDEFADLMMVAGKKIEELIARLAQKARAAGIHLILATQRPSVDVITGLIKANIPTRIAFQVSSKVDSRTILDQMGAEALLGQGDMLYLPPGTGYPQRVHGAFCADDEVHAVVEHLKQTGEPDYIDGILNGGFEAEAAGGGAPWESGGTEGTEGDALYDEAVAFVLKSRKASISSVQRQLRIGYNRAARLIEQMEQAGLVSPMETNGNRTVLAPAHE
ncbi:DNA segregation ATPase FtsK/SpoIIIE, S-DNA-T family [Andreprevotia lacus DSM 23236]|jgi:S-DNA-T family DNA segregation ATPase FtsK/SpoIIIE|uniref:DNA segregation ATPase FtsK/SpoIIIE, S-DNA-T family n=1 Tax=Andreprevotia lacus DSM 23236 TaxID=1121001 RepID=A0A1W1XQQ5_9NEIS|nr:DNA translocase FtsK [Andreprevotia lacus]SMC26185.1 DNA segregation ATPase FtsK/SpoIIIE, S-DNA-T family [Andreprevotia lacus DSM 23236]